MADTAHILLFHVEAGKAEQIQNICRKLGIHTSKIKLTSYSQKLGYLAGISGFRRENISYTGPDFPSEMMVFFGMNSDMLDCFLEEYKKGEIFLSRRLPYKKLQHSSELHIQPFNLKVDRPCPIRFFRKYLCYWLSLKYSR